MTSTVSLSTTRSTMFDVENEIARAGLPVIERIADDLGELAISIVLTDAHSNVVGQVVGAPSFEITLDGAGAYVTAPIADPRRDVSVGAVGVTCAVADAGPLMLPYAQLAARIIAERMVDRAAVADRTLLEHFLRARRRARGPLLAVNDRELLTNGAAARLVQPHDHARIWNRAISALEANERSADQLELSTTVVSMRSEAVFVGTSMVGALVHLEERRPVSTIRLRSRKGDPGRPTLGWESLSAGERGIAELVAEGLTNREVAARIFVSPHTVDFHLRQIYRKLSISSRIELTRLVIEHADTPSRDVTRVVAV